jgi:dethiobiotin synthase
VTRGVFVTGTDTGVGKTLMAAGILRWLRSRGLDAVPMKPVQTGGRRDGERLVSTDLEFCLSAAGLRLSRNELGLASPYVYEPACSPHLAGRMAGQYPEISTIRDCAEVLLRNHRAVVVEGAGGIMVPLNESETMLDLMKTLGFPVVLVSRVGLGSINHALLSVQALRAAGLDLIGVVFNHTEPPAKEDGFIEEDNPRTIARFGDVRELGEVGYLGPDDKGDEMWRRFEGAVPGLQRILDIVR